MKHPKTPIACALGILILLATFAGVVLFQPTDEESRYQQLLRAHRNECRFAHWRTNAAYRFVSSVTRHDWIGSFGQKADKLETSIRQSGGLVRMTFLVKGVPTQLNFQTARMRYYTNESFWFMPGELQHNNTNQYVRYNFRKEGQINLVCRPKDSAFWQTSFCCITNQVRWRDLWELGGNIELPCRLPDGSIVELDAARNWLNNSVRDGWLVGVRLERDQRGDNLLVASRRKRSGE